MTCMNSFRQLINLCPCCTNLFSVLILKMWPVELYLVKSHNILIHGHVVLIHSLF